MSSNKDRSAALISPTATVLILIQTPVMAVTERTPRLRETRFVNMVRRVSKKTLLEPGDTRQQWKGEAAASLVCTGITSSCALPTSSAGYWSPTLTCDRNKRLQREEILWGRIFLPDINNLVRLIYKRRGSRSPRSRF